MTQQNVLPWRLVIAASIGMFAATSTGSTRSPFLPDIAADLSVSLPAVANLFGVTACSWGISSFVAGRLSDRLGRRPFLFGAPVCLALAMFAVAHVPTYTALVIITIFAGLCCGAFTATAMAEVSVQTGVSHQGRALGYVMTGQSLTLLVGVPLAAWLGASIGWRGMHLVLAGLAAFAVVAMIFGLRSQETGVSTSKTETRTKSKLGEAMTGPVIRLFIALVFERICFGLAVFYYASYLRTAYNLPVSDVALPLVVFALGNILGTMIGGQVADKFPYRRISFAVALVIAGCFAVPWFAWPAGLGITVGFGVLFAFFNGMARPPLLAALADVPPQFRGAVMGLNSAIASLGWLTAALAGGWLYAGIGFVGFSPLMALMCVIAAIVVVPDTRLVQQQKT